MRLLPFLFFFILSSQAFSVFGQDTTKTKNVFWVIPSNARYINGISLGLFNKPKVDRKQTVNGISIEIFGLGWQLPLLAMDDGKYMEKSEHKLKQNGILIGTTLMAGTTNGLTVSPILACVQHSHGLLIATFNMCWYEASGLVLGAINNADKLKGVQIGANNWAGEMRGMQIGIHNSCTQKSNGLQIGLVNHGKNFRGLQIGLINKIGRRITPLVNWNFQLPTE